jgi:hypothetical protein
MRNRAIAAALAAACVASPVVAAPKPAARPTRAEPSAPAEPSAAELALSSEEAAQLTNWVIAAGDNGDLPFLVIDKIAAQVFVFDPRGRLLGRSPALLGITPGDDSTPGVGDRELSEIKPEDRTTPAGRFVASNGWASGNRRVLWVDYATSVSLHPVVTTKKKERRLQRLKSKTASDNRITYGCINVPAAFYSKTVRPLFAKGSGVVYILPETKPLNEVFLAYRPQPLPKPGPADPPRDEATANSAAGTAATREKSALNR